MALATGADQFSPNVRAFQYWYEQRSYTALDSALPNGSEPVVNVQSLGDFTQNPTLAVLSDLGQTEQSDVALQVDMGGTAQGATKDWQVTPQRTIPSALWPSGLAPLLPSPQAGWFSPSKLQLTWQNTSGSALGNAMQLNYAVALTPMTVLQKQRLGMGLTPDEHQLLQEYGQYLTPWSLAEALETVWGSAYLGEEEEGAVFSSVESSASSIGPFAPANGELLVLRGLAASLPNGSVGNRVTAQIQRDTPQPLHELLLDNAAGLDTPFPFRVTARSSLKLNVSANTTTSNVAVRIRLAHYALTPVLATLMGIPGPSPSAADQRLIAEAQLGGMVR